MKFEAAVRAISDTNTAIYSIGFSTGKSEVGRESAKILGDSDPGPAGGCMARNHADDPETSNNVAMQAYDCLSLLAPPLRLAKVAFLAIRDGMQRNVPETIAKLTGGEYFKLTDAKSLERDLHTISNHIPTATSLASSRNPLMRVSTPSVYRHPATRVSLSPQEMATGPTPTLRRRLRRRFHSDCLA